MKKLSELFPDHQLKTVQECIAEYGWKTEHPEGDERGTGLITCKCGHKVEIIGCIGVDRAYCSECGIGMQDVTGLIPGGNAYMVHIDYETTEIPEDGRVWITFRMFQNEAEV